MGAGHHHHGGERSEKNRRRLTITLALAGGYMIAEIVGGLLANSLALLADAGHMLSDVAALALSLFALWIAQRPPTPQRTYGYYRAEILAALANGATLIAISLFIFWEAYKRLDEPPEVQGPLLLGVAAGGLAVNLAGLWVLNAGKTESLNIRGAWLHVLTDALGSVGAIAAGALIWAFNWNWADPAISVLIGILVIYSAWHLLAEAVAVLMEGAPGHIDVDEVRNTMIGLPGVSEVHDLHVWTITTGQVALSGHVRLHEGDARPTLLQEMSSLLHDRFGIDHTTIQLEPADFEEHETCR